MVEIELVRRRRVRRARRLLRRRADLLLTLAAVAVVAVLVAVDVVSSSSPPRRTPSALPDLPTRTAVAPTSTEVAPGVVEVGTRAATDATGRRTDEDAAAGLAVGERAHLARAQDPRPPVALVPGPVAPPQDGPLTALVDPLLGRLSTALPILEPVRRTAREVTTCTDETFSGTTKADTGCPVPASRR